MRSGTGTSQGGVDASDRISDSVTISPQARTTADAERITREVDQLQQDEARVKAHEAAHKAAGGQYAGSVSYSYRQGPDGRSYVSGGEVQIDVSPEKTPRETISKMATVIRAAMAPADPSGQDRAVAAQAASQMAEAERQQATVSSTVQPADSATAASTDQTGDSSRNVSSSAPAALSPQFSTYA